MLGLAGPPFLVFAGCAHSPQPSKAFPLLANHKPQLQNLQVLCEVSVWQRQGPNEGFGEGLLYFDEASALGSTLARRTEEALAAKDYAVDGSSFVSSGLWPPKWRRSPHDSMPGPPRGPADEFTSIFIRDSTLLRSPELVGAWRDLLHRLEDLDNRSFPRFYYEPSPHDHPAFLPEAVVLCSGIGAGAVAVMRFRFSANIESVGHTLEPARSHKSRVFGGPLFGSSTTMELTLVDGRTGEVLWNDARQYEGPYDRDRIEKTRATLVERLP